MLQKLNFLIYLQPTVKVPSQKEAVSETEDMIAVSFSFKQNVNVSV